MCDALPGGGGDDDDDGGGGDGDDDDEGNRHIHMGHCDGNKHREVHVDENMG